MFANRLSRLLSWNLKTEEDRCALLLIGVEDASFWRIDLRNKKRTSRIKFQYRTQGEEHSFPVFRSRAWILATQPAKRFLLSEIHIDPTATGARRLSGSTAVSVLPRSISTLPLK